MTEPTPLTVTAHPLPTALNEAEQAFITQECDRLLMLYNEAQSNVQSVFNFYLTFLTTVVGGVVVIVQTGGGSPVRTQLIITLLLIFAALVGSVYLSAIAFRYARSKRYAIAVDALRIFLIRQDNLRVPSIYSTLTAQPPEIRRKVNPLIWLLPSGTYQMFIALINSAFLSISAALVAITARAEFSVGLATAVLIFVQAQIIYNVYAQLVIRQFANGVSISNQKTDLWAGSN